ncbi:MAG: helix-turn-helix domain-containing protein [Acidimicrobiales bacterium]
MGTRRTVKEIEAHVGSQFRALRKSAGWTQRELARAAGVSVSTIRNLETGEGSSLSTIIEVSRALDRVDWLDGIVADDADANRAAGESAAAVAPVSPMAMLAEAKRR